MALTRTRFSQADTRVSKLTDPLTVLNDNSTIANVDVGFVINRNLGTKSNVAFYWNEAGNTFVMAATSDTGITNSNINLSNFVNLNLSHLIAAEVYADNFFFANSQPYEPSPQSSATDFYAVNFSAPNVLISGGYIDGTAIGANIAAQGNFTTISSTQTVTSYGNIVAASGTESTSATTGALVVNGGVGVTGNVVMAGDIVPDANVTYSLGSSDRRWKDLWLAGNTLYIGSETMQVSADGVWQFSSNNATVKIGQNEPLAIFQLSAADTIKADGNIVAGANTSSTSTTTGALVVVGGAGIGGDSFIGGNLTVTGNLDVQGNVVTIGSADLAVEDSIINLHTLPNLAPLTFNDGRDIGIKVHYYDYQDEHAFFGRAANSGYFEWYDSGREVGNLFVGNTYGTIKAGQLILANATASSNFTEGALVVTGGAGIGGNLYVNTNIIVGNTIEALVGSLTDVFSSNLHGVLRSTSQPYVTQVGTLGSLQVSGNIDANHVRAATVGNTSTNINGTLTQSSQPNITLLGNLITANVSGNLNAGNITTAGLTAQRVFTTDGLYWAGNGVSYIPSDFNAVNASGNIVAASGTATSGVTTGALVVVGGVGISGDVYAGSLQNTAIGTQFPSTGSFTALNASLVLNVQGNILARAGTPSSNVATGALVVVGGIGTSGNVNLGGILKAAGNIVAHSETESVSTATGAITVVGGVGVSGNVYSNKLYTSGIFWAANNQPIGGPASGSNGDIQYNLNGQSAASSLFYSSATGNVVATNTTTSTGVNTGALVVKGGLGVAGNIFAGGISGPIYGTLYIGTTDVNYNRASAAQVLTGVGIDGTAATAGNSINSQITSNVSNGTAYITFTNRLNANAALNAATALTYVPDLGKLVPYALEVTTAANIFGNTNANILNISGNVYLQGGTISNIGDIYTNTLYTTTGIRWSGNGNVFASGGGGGGTYTASTSPPSNPSNGDQWYNTSTDVLYEYLNDGTASYWVDVQTPIISGNVPIVAVSTLSPFLLAGM